MLKWCYSPPDLLPAPRGNWSALSLARLKTNCMPASASAAAGAHYSWTTHAARCTLRITADVQMKSGFNDKEIMSLLTHHVHAKTDTHFFSSTLLFRYYTQAASIAESVKRRSDVCYRKNTSVLTGIYSKWLTRGNTDAAGVRAGRFVAVVPRSWSWTGL